MVYEKLAAMIRGRKVEIVRPLSIEEVPEGTCLAYGGWERRAKLAGCDGVGEVEGRFILENAGDIPEAWRGKHLGFPAWRYKDNILCLVWSYSRHKREISYMAGTSDVRSFLEKAGLEHATLGEVVAAWDTLVAPPGGECVVRGDGVMESLVIHWLTNNIVRTIEDLGGHFQTAYRYERRGYCIWNQDTVFATVPTRVQAEHLDPDRIIGLADKELQESQIAPGERTHLEACQACRQEIRAMRIATAVGDRYLQTRHPQR